MEHFIESVRKYPCLWKVDSEDYKNNEIKEAAWRNVIVECDVADVKEAKSMWKKLRDGHRQALNKKKTTTGQAASKDNKVWKYEKQMDFLLPHLTNRQRSSNATAASEDMTTSANNDDGLENTQTEEYSNLNTTENDTQQATHNTPRNKRKIDKLTEYLEQEQKRRDVRSKERDLFRTELLARQEKVKPKEDTALKKFFDSMCDVTHDLPEYLQMQIQSQLFSIVMEARQANFTGTTVYSSSTPSQPSSPNDQWCNVREPNATYDKDVRGYLNDQATYADM